METKLSSIYHKFGRFDTDDHDLHSVALRFRLLRQHGFCVSPDVFQRFKDEEGRFDLGLAKDASGLMSLYEAAQLEHPGEDILEEAKNFATSHLQALVPFLEPSQAKQVEHVLEHPFHKTLPRIEARRCIDIFNDGCEIDRDMVDLAILDFNHIQSIHQTELQEFSRWWEGTGISKEMGSLIRNQPILWFMLSCLALPEPQFSRCRIELAKLTALVFVIDDLFDVCGELEDLVVFTEAVDSLDPTSVEPLPNCMNLCFVALMNVVKNGIGFLALKPQDSVDILHRSNAMWGSLCKAFLQEARWLRLEDAPTANEYLKNATTTSGLILYLTYAYFILACQQMSIMKPLDATPSLIHLPAAIFRLWDDLGTSRDEKDRGYDASYIEFYVKEYDVSEECARKETLNLIGDAWRKLNQASMQSGLHDFPPAFIRFALNCARVGQLLYAFGKDDRQTTIEEHIRKMLIEKIHV
ncbi:(3S,6E)-nerolidol synthase 1-like [Nymphaea colorata]|nr:(3S,6E)-nerolidol synthase 1-like [Nymphaea colorata]